MTLEAARTPSHRVCDLESDSEWARGRDGAERVGASVTPASGCSCQLFLGGTHLDVGKVSHRSDPVAAITVCALSFFFFF